ncbi:MAG TPA: PA2779 family protein, partial [Burkholderiales bacterium]|nr:PA2779 family protein [Burkholderiales bacterium]
TDAEAAELAARIDDLPAGGIGIVGAILVVFLVLLLTDILGYTKIFPFTRSAR